MSELAATADRPCSLGRSRPVQGFFVLVSDSHMAAATQTNKAKLVIELHTVEF